MAARKKVSRGAIPIKGGIARAEPKGNKSTTVLGTFVKGIGNKKQAAAKKANTKSFNAEHGRKKGAGKKGKTSFAVKGKGRKGPDDG